MPLSLLVMRLKKYKKTKRNRVLEIFKIEKSF